MKQYTVYVCDKCKYENRDIKKMREHEAVHLGLTVKEMEQYMGLQSYAAYMGSVVSRTKNEITDKAFDDAIQNLLDFEQKHGIKGR